MYKLEVRIANSQKQIAVIPGLCSGIRKAIRLTLEMMGIPGKINSDCRIDIAFADDRQIRELNKVYRGIDKATDVLSFPGYEAADFAKKWKRTPEPPAHLGDVVISLETALRQCGENGRSFLSETVLLAVHSALHLTGLDHITLGDEKKMFAKQDFILKRMKL